VNWAVSSWPGTLTRNQAISALTIAEHLTIGYAENNPLVIALRQELPHG
jgi:hypothetical protein